MTIALIGAAMLAAAAGLLCVARPRGGKSPRFMDSKDVAAAVATFTTGLVMGGVVLVVVGINE